MSHPLSQEQRRQIGQQLITKYQSMLEDIDEEKRQSDDAQYQNLAGDVRDPGDDSVADLMTDLNATILHKHLHALQEIEQAQQRLKADTINTCVDCDQEIGFQRLLAYPTAMRCLNCQAQHERNYSGHESPSL